VTWLRREDLEDRELRRLSRWGTPARASGGRRKPESEDPMRTAFQRDRDRIIHSRAFRRLQHKTQVLAAYEGDHFRSRMVHSLEVAQMARGVSAALHLNPDLAEAVALAHDLGHPPFGHAGEQRLDTLMASHGGFRHNAQGARIVDTLEDRYGHEFGLNLTLAVRRSLLKGPVPVGFPLADDLTPDQPLPLEAQIVDRCDKIAYLCHDLDDGIRAGMVDPADAARLALWQRAADRVAEPGRTRVLSEMISLLIHDLVAETDRALEDAAEGPPQARHSSDASLELADVLAFLRERFYRAERVIAVMNVGCDRIESTFLALRRDPSGLPERHRRRLERQPLERILCDYVAGMTDRFLLQQADGAPPGRP